MKKILRVLALLCALLLPLTADAESTSFPVAKQRVSSTVRVLLSRLGITDRMDLTLDGQYVLTCGENVTMAFQRKSVLTILLKNDHLIVYYEGMRLDAGQTLTLERWEQADGFRLANNDALYQGDLRLTVREGVIRFVLSMNVEDYLMGVVPYEMGEGFPLEALKAQAVASRTYALCKLDDSRDYDVVDTTNDQVFKGRRDGNETVEQAVTETSGLCGFYKGKLSITYYSASNGGQTDLVENVWDAKGDYGYYAMNDDSYDLENPKSTVRKVTVPKKAQKVEDTPYVFRLLLAGQLESQLLAEGFDASPESLRVDEVLEIRADTPKFADPSRVMTMLHVTFRYSARTRTDAPTSVPQASTPMPDEEVNLWAPVETLAPTDAATPQSTTSLRPTATPAPTYGEFVAKQEAVTLDIPIFPMAEKALGLGINSYDNELVTVSETDDAFAIESRRFGHGVGLSQRGAEWMALRYDKTFTDILAFYFPGMELQRLDRAEQSEATLAPDTFETPGPAPTPTPKPTLMPVTQAAPEGAWYAAVTEIDEDSSLNLRAEPDLSSDIVMRLYRGQRLLVLQRCPQEGWVKVATDTAEGYVLEKFLTAEE